MGMTFGVRNASAWDKTATNAVEFVKVELDNKAIGSNAKEQDSAKVEADTPNEINAASDGEHNVGDLIDFDIVAAPPARLIVIGIVPATSARTIESITKFTGDEDPESIVGWSP